MEQARGGLCNWGWVYISLSTVVFMSDDSSGLLPHFWLHNGAVYVRGVCWPSLTSHAMRKLIFDVEEGAL